MEIYYTAKAKEDLIKIYWKTRNLIISNIAESVTNPINSVSTVRPIPNTELHKLDFNDYIAISKINENKINILTIIEKRKIKIPD